LNLEERNSLLAHENRALVVDDNYDIVELLATVLRGSGYEVETASSPSEALDKCERESFGIIVADIGMPVMNGYQFARKLRVSGKYHSAVMIALTGYSIYDDRNLAIEAGFDELITKPDGVVAVLAAIERIKKRRNGVDANP
jgi:two-component system OmpR family response regulator